MAWDIKSNNNSWSFGKTIGPTTIWDYLKNELVGPIIFLKLQIYDHNRYAKLCIYASTSWSNSVGSNWNRIARKIYFFGTLLGENWPITMVSYSNGSHLPSSIELSWQAIQILRVIWEITIVQRSYKCSWNSLWIATLFFW